jgi:hypothetical protein
LGGDGSRNLVIRRRVLTMFVWIAIFGSLAMHCGNDAAVEF